VAEQVRDPFRILHIGLTPWHLLDVLCVRHHNLQRSFQNGVDRLPNLRTKKASSKVGFSRALNPYWITRIL
jgi:hypothetical protein